MNILRGIFKNWRINLVFILILLFGGAIISQLVRLQINQHDLYKALAKGQQSNFSSISGKRGQIFFSTGQILASNVKNNYLFVSPGEIEDKEKTADKISAVFSLNKENILSKLNKNSLYEKIKDALTEEDIIALETIELKGIHLGEDISRSYPQNQLASTVIGFLGKEGVGQYGIEGFYDNSLKGEEGFYKDNEFKNIYNGKDMFLTIDYNVQFMAESFLNQAKESLDIKGGGIIIMDPNTGKVLALAEYPNFDPNNYSLVKDFSVFKNDFVQNLFEPGSTLKPVTMAIAIEEGKITPNTTYIDRGNVKIGAHTIENYNKRVFGEATMTTVLEKSINTGAVFAESLIGHKKFLEYLEKFGFFELTGIDIQGEVFSENRELKKGYEVNFATASFGQGIEMTPIQLIRAFSALANGGKLPRPYIVEKIVDNEGKITETKPELSENIISQSAVSKITAMLISVMENGFSKSGRIPGYYIAGKTGTAQIPWASLGINKKGYSNETWQSFIGFFPAFNPRFLIFVKLDNPKANTAEYSALPVFKQMAKYIIDYYAIPPDYESH